MRFTLFAALSLVSLTSAKNLRALKSDIYSCHLPAAPADACCTEVDHYLVKDLSNGNCITKDDKFTLNDDFSWNTKNLAGKYEATDDNGCNCD